MSIPVLFVLLPNVLMLDLAGPAEVLRLASQAADGPVFDLQYVCPVPEVRTSIGLPLSNLAPLPETLAPDTMVVLLGASAPYDGGLRHEAEQADAAVIAWLQRTVAPAGVRLTCICAGAMNAARAGLLNGRHCTTHHSLCDTLQRLAPNAKVLEDRLYVIDGPVSTSAGITAGIDLMLQVLTTYAGPQLACAVARNMVVYLRRAGADPQLSPWLSGRNHLHPALHRVQDALAAHPADDWSLERMATLACTSSRHLARLFQTYTGASALDHLHRLRLALAKQLITHSSQGLETIAQQAGFGSARQLRRVWARYDPVPPSAYR